MKNTEIAIFAAGCFWGVEEEFRITPGVVETEVGYTGGVKENATYEEVCTGRTGHAEAVKVTFDPALITYEELLDKFWELHDPTTLNRQGPDVGSQYRSAIFYTDESQKNLTQAARNKLVESRKYAQPIVTQIEPAGQFFRAEEYHQKYVLKTGKKVC